LTVRCQRQALKSSHCRMK
jgi:hypothetical protein